MRNNINTYKYLFSNIETGNCFWRIGIYVRLSKDDGKGKSVSLSVVNQIKFMSFFLEGLSDYLIYDIYIDDGRTGTDFDRTDYQRLQRDIDQQKVNCIVVKDLTRFVRNVAEGIKELDGYVLEKKIRFVSCGNPKIDTFRDPHAITSPAVYAALQNAEDVARITSEKVRDNQAVKRRFGEPTGGFPPYGFLTNPNPEEKNWVIDPIAGKVRQDILIWSREGMTDCQIARKLNALGIPNPTTYKQQILKLNYKNPHAEKNSGLWWPATVSRILSDQTNIGSMVQHKSESFDHKRHKQIPVSKEEQVIKENCHEQLVTEDFFNCIQTMRQHRTRSIKNTGKVHIFSNLVYCSHCKKTMKKNSARGYEYLVCRTYKEFGSDYCTTKRSIRFKTLENIVLKVIQMQIMLIENVCALMKTVKQQPTVINQTRRIDKLITQVKTEIKEIEHLLDLSYFDWKKGDIAKEQYQRIAFENEKKVKQLKDGLQLLLLEKQQKKSEIKEINEYFEIFLKYKNVQKLDRLLLLELVKKIYIFQDKSIRIEFKYQDQYRLILEYMDKVI